MNDDVRQGRAQHLVATAEMMRLDTAAQLKGDDLTELGLLAVNFARFEEFVAFCCEVLLMRAELGGFNGPSPKRIIDRGFVEKLDLLRKLAVAIGVLYSVSIDEVLAVVAHGRTVGERRNTVIHGYLHRRDEGNVVFRNRQTEVIATADALSELNADIYNLDITLSKRFLEFFKSIMLVSSKNNPFDHLLVTVVEARIKVVEGQLNIRQKSKSLRELEISLQKAKERLSISKTARRESRERLAEVEAQLVEAYMRERPRLTKDDPVDPRT